MNDQTQIANPYVGLRPFEREDSLYFFGRREQTAELLQRLYETHFLAVVGSSGCGKSSLIRAGLIPALLGGFLVEQRDKWRIAIMKPGDAPLSNLAGALYSTDDEPPDKADIEALRSAIVEEHTQAVVDYLTPRLGSDTNLLLLLDQFEEISVPPSGAKPRFVVAAWMDDFIGTPLEQIQIIKGWVDRNGKTQERVYRLAGHPGNPNHPERSLFPQSCELKPGGHEQLCKTWEDPHFRPEERAFYYARVLEKPVCRYSTHWCRERIGVDPLDPKHCQADLDTLADSPNPLEQLRASHGAECCSNQDGFPYVQPVIQERAWTSPIWYTPE